MATDIATIKQAQQVAWGQAGAYNQIGKLVAFESELLCEAVGIQAHHEVLDVATGSGNTALAAARRNSAHRAESNVIGVDFSEELLDIARRRAEADGLGIRFQQADAAELPFPDDSFDIVLSTFGVMFVPDQERVAGELLRVCRPGGRIGLANWTPDSQPAQAQKAIGAYVPPPPGVPSPALWGTEERLRELFGDRVHLRVEERDAVFHYRQPDDFIDAFSQYYGPVVKALEKLEASERQKLITDLNELTARYARAVEGSCEITARYLQAVATVR